jgi:hypothetical protein
VLQVVSGFCLLAGAHFTAETAPTLAAATSLETAFYRGLLRILLLLLQVVSGFGL